MRLLSNAVGSCLFGLPNIYTMDHLSADESSAVCLLLFRFSTAHIIPKDKAHVGFDRRAASLPLILDSQPGFGPFLSAS